MARRLRHRARRARLVATGEAPQDGALDAKHWPDGQRPAPLETSMPGIFAIGGARAGSVQRAAAAVRKGAAVAAQIHDRSAAA